MLLMIGYSFVFFSILLSTISDLIPGVDHQKIQLNRYGKNIEIDIFTLNPDSIDVDIINVTKGATIKQFLYNTNNSNEYFLVCNAGMFDIDNKTNMGYMKNKGDVLNSRKHPQYYSVMAFDPLLEKLPNFYLYDTDVTSLDSIISKYDSVIQNLRLIKRNGENRWPKQDKRWQELAIGQDADNNIIIIYCHNSLSMSDFNELILSLPLKLVTAQHLEGNFSAQLYFRFDKYKIDYDNGEYVPNLIGFKSKKF